MEVSSLVVSGIIGFLLGIPAGIVANTITIFLQFKHSIARRQVILVAEATKRIYRAVKTPAHETKNTGQLRDLYRYSLSVMIDELVTKFGQDDFKERGPWPLIAQSNGDRWSRFDTYVRPVSDDLDISTFGFLPRFFVWGNDRKILYMLTKLAQLCERLEIVVGQLDAAYEERLVFEKMDTGEIFPQPGNDSAKLRELVDEFRKLHHAWREWLKAIDFDILAS